MPHFHVLVNKYISLAWLKEAAVSSGFGPIMDIRDARNGGIMSYVLKYLRKGMTDDEFLSAMLIVRGRRYGFSRGMYAKDRGSVFSPLRCKWSRTRSVLHAWLHIHNFGKSRPSVTAVKGWDNVWNEMFIPNPNVLYLAPP
jgi:hypothetical protein